MMVAAAILDWAGTAVTLVALGFVALFVFRQWKTSAPDGAVFLRRRWLRSILGIAQPVVSAHIVVEVAASTETATVHKVEASIADLSLEDRLDILEGRIAASVSDHEALAKRHDARLANVEASVAAAKRESEQGFRNQEVSAAHDLADNLHNAGWSLVWSVLGLIMQLVGSVFAFMADR